MEAPSFSRRRFIAAARTVGFGCCLLLCGNSPAQHNIPAFPGAEGYGKYATGGRGGTVCYVTNLNDAGPGSLRDALSKPDRTILFRISGTIFLKSTLVIDQDNITIAGQTAPGDGICVAGYGTSIRASNIIIRHLRFRMGDIAGKEGDALGNGLAPEGAVPYNRIIVDHCSMSWGTDEVGSFYGITDCTVQWCILSESLFRSNHSKGNHGYGGIWGGERVSFHHNLLAHHSSRNPRFGYMETNPPRGPRRQLVDFRNNVIYNWGYINSAYGGEGGEHNLAHNYYKYGPATPGGQTSSAANKRNRILQYTGFSIVRGDTVWGGRFYIDSNYVDGFPDVSADNWKAGVQPDNRAAALDLLQTARHATPFPYEAVTYQPAEKAYQLVLAGAGAILPKRDTVDKRIVREVMNREATYEGEGYVLINSIGIRHPSGIIDSQRDVGGWPVLSSASPPHDSDGDGIPDAWEKQYGLDPDDPGDGNSFARDGYTMLEKYLNSIGSSAH